MQNPFPIQNKSDRIYSPCYNRNQVDLFYELAEFVHNIMINEVHTHPSTGTPLFELPSVQNYGPIPIQKGSLPSQYIYSIRYHVAKRVVSSDYDPTATIVVELHSRSSMFPQYTTVEVYEHYGYPMEKPSKFHKINKMEDDLMEDPEIENNTEKIKDLLKLWILIPRSTKTTTEITSIYKELEKIYYERIKFLHEQLPEAAPAMFSKFHTESMTPWFATAATNPDVFRSIRQFGLPQYPPPVP